MRKILTPLSAIGLAVTMLTAPAGAITFTTGSSFSNSSISKVGIAATGTMIVNGGSTLNNSGSGDIGSSSSGNGTVTVTGSGSQWNMGGTS